MKLVDTLGFDKLYTLVKSTKLPIKTAYKFSKLAQQFQTESDFYKQELQKIINDCGQLDENGRPVPTDDGQGIKLIKEKEGECMTRLGELQNLDVTIESEPFTLDELDKLDITIEDMGILMPFIKD